MLKILSSTLLKKTTKTHKKHYENTVREAYTPRAAVPSD
jgi:hypothetical protein